MKCPVRLSSIPALAAVLLSFALPARAQEVVYNLSFGNTLNTVNYSMFQSGYLIADPTAGTFSTVLILVDPNTFRLYYSADLASGSYFEVRGEADGARHAVMFGSTGGSGGVDNVALQLVGKVDRRVGLGDGTSTRVAGGLRGILLASAPGTVPTENSEETEPTFGFAGQSRLRAGLDIDLTNLVNSSTDEEATAVSVITDLLESWGITTEASPSPSPSPTATPTPVTSPTPTPSPTP